MLISCSDSTETMSGGISRGNSYFISKDSAVIIANKAVASISGVPCDKTRGIEGRIVKSVNVVNNMQKYMTNFRKDTDNAMGEIEI